MGLLLAINALTPCGRVVLSKPASCKDLLSFIFRDLKPENILLDDYGKSQRSAEMLSR